MTWLYVHDFPNLMRRFARHPATNFLGQAAKAFASLFAKKKKKKGGRDMSKNETEKAEDEQAEEAIAAAARNRARLVARRNGGVGAGARHAARLPPQPITAA
jgi:hypothetical protein